MDGLRVQLKNPGRNNHSLRSPNVHRSDEFKVSLRGWLYRLEGAALKQWKRRWCVLADYCLFYYKDVAEEKMLGSLLLPSYRISPCFSNDGISRKFSFKAEHNNMKTYYFAADNKEAQQQWMNALSMASIMQHNIFGTDKLSKPTHDHYKRANQHNVSNQHLNGNSQLLGQSKMSINKNDLTTEDESGFVAYQVKQRLEGNGAIMYGTGYDFNYADTSLNLFNSVGLPSVYPDPMSACGSYATPPPKPQRQYYDPAMTYDMPSVHLMDYKFAAPELTPNSAPYYMPNYDNFYSQNCLPQPYPDFMNPAQFHDYPPTYHFQRLPPRPHSADFLERNQDDDFDEECQNAFEKNDALLPNGPNLAPKILPSRPKSSIARYDPMMRSQIGFQQNLPYNEFENNTKLFDKKDISTFSLNGGKPPLEHSTANQLSQYFHYSNNNNNNGNKEEGVNDSQIMSNYLKGDKAASMSAPVRPPLPPEYALKFDSPITTDSTLTRNCSISGKVLAKSDSTGKETSYSSDDEMRKPLHNKTVRQTVLNDLVEISKEEYYKASQMFYQRQRHLQASTPAIETASSDLSDTAIRPSTQATRANDWGEVGLPVSPVKPSPPKLIITEESVAHDRRHLKSSSSSNSSTAAQNVSTSCQQSFAPPDLDKASSCSSIQSANLNSIEQEVRFKLGGKVRTYKKPRNSSAFSLETSSDNSSIETALTPMEAINSALISDYTKSVANITNGASANAAVNEPVDGGIGIGAKTTANAPYYYSDLLTEEQKIALQKKLGNFASPPPLLSRCTSINNARYLGMTSLTFKPKNGPISGEKSATTGQSTNDCIDSKRNTENVDNDLNELREMCQSDTKRSPKESLVNNGLRRLPLENESPTASLPSNNDNYDSPPRRTLCSSEDPLGNQRKLKEDKKKSVNFDNYFCSLDEMHSSDCLDSLREFQSRTVRKRKIKRKSKEELNNVSDSEIHKKSERYRKARSFKYSKRLCFSAADYVGKSQEELILMLIQLRRRQSELSKSGNKLRLQMESEAKMMELEPHRKEEYSCRFKELKQKLIKIEKEYQFRQPIVDTIDGMIKLKCDTNDHKAASTSVLNDDASLNCHTRPAISANAQRPRFAQEESTYPTLTVSSHSTKQQACEKRLETESVSSAVESVDTPTTDPIENLKKQQSKLASELDRVRGLLTHSTKKLEEKAVENAQMEQEMLIARNKLKQVLENEQEAMEITRSSKLEAELAHINNVIDDLHSRRKELNTAIENLKKSDSAYSTEKQYSLRSAATNSDQMVSSPDIAPFVPAPNGTCANVYRDLFGREYTPLYENLSGSRDFEQEEPEIVISNGMFDQVNNNLDNSENDEFFTLNINLDKPQPYSHYMQDPSVLSEINNNNSQQNLNTMCEFDPTKAYGESISSIVDQQIKQIYNYQPLPKANEIKTVREVKREAERRKYHQHQSQKMNNLYRQERPLVNGSSYHMLPNHFYSETSEPVPLALNPVMANNMDKIDEFDDVLQVYNSKLNQAKILETSDEINKNQFTAPDIVQSTIRFNEGFCDGET